MDFETATPLPSALAAACATAAAETIVTALCHAAGEAREGPWLEQFERLLELVSVADAVEVELLAGEDEDLAANGVEVELLAGEDEDLAANGAEVELLAGEDEDLAANGVEVELLAGEDEDLAANGVEVELLAGEEHLAANGVEIELLADEEYLAVELAGEDEDLAARVEAGCSPCIELAGEDELAGDDEPLAGGAAEDRVAEGVESGLLGARRAARPLTIALRRLSREELRIGALLYPERTYWRPQSRGDCADVPRPCPFVQCKYHLYLDVNVDTGNIKLNAPDIEVWQMKHSCALDIADNGGSDLAEVGRVLNLSRERIRQMEFVALAKLLRAAPHLHEYLPLDEATPSDAAHAWPPE